MTNSSDRPLSLIDLRVWLRQKSQMFIDPIVAVINRTGLTPNMLTFIGLLLNVGE